MQLHHLQDEDNINTKRNRNHTQSLHYKMGWGDIKQPSKAKQSKKTVLIPPIHHFKKTNIQR